MFFRRKALRIEMYLSMPIVWMYVCLFACMEREIAHIEKLPRIAVSKQNRKIKNCNMSLCLMSTEKLFKLFLVASEYLP